MVGIGLRRGSIKRRFGLSGKSVVLVHHEKHGLYWRWGNETFYDDLRRLITFQDEEEARVWLSEHQPDLVIDQEV